MDFLGAGAAEGEHLAAGGGAADDRIFNDDDPFAFDHFGNDDEFHADGEVAHVLRGLDEGAADVTVGNDAFFEGDAGFLGIAKGARSEAGVGDGDDDVGVDGGFAGKLPAHFLADVDDHVAEEIAGRAGEVDVFKGTVGRLGVGFGEEAAGELGAGAVDGDNFAGLNFAEIGRLDALERAGFGGHTVIAVERAAEDQRTETPGITAGFDAIGEEEDERRSALQVAEDVGEGIGFFLVGGLGEHVEDDFGIGGGVEDVAELLVLGLDAGGVDEVAIVGDGDLAADVFLENGLGVAFAVGAGGGVADVAGWPGPPPPVISSPVSCLRTSF